MLGCLGRPVAILLSIVRSHLTSFFYRGSLTSTLWECPLLDNVYGTSEGPRGRGETSLEHVLISKIRELEKKAEVQSLRHEELLLEMQSLKKTHSSPKNSWSRSGSLSAELPSPESGDITP
ncbi:hypothetical protein Anas_02131, partial [Armadillidium nasatum]